MNKWLTLIAAISVIGTIYFIAYSFASNDKITITYPIRSCKHKKKTGKKKVGILQNRKFSLFQPVSKENTKLLLHPNSSRRGKQDFVENALMFRSLYEPLFCAVKTDREFAQCSDVLKSWEEKLIVINAEYLLLAWSTIIHKYCPRNYYVFGVSGCEGNLLKEQKILADWLNQLYKWGLRREDLAATEKKNHIGSSTEFF